MNYHPPSQPLPAPCIIDSGVVIAKEDMRRLLDDIGRVRYIHSLEGVIQSEGEGWIVEVFADYQQSTLVANYSLYLNTYSFDYLRLTRSPDGETYFDLIQDNRQLRLIPLSNPLQDPDMKARPMPIPWKPWLLRYFLLSGMCSLKTKTTTIAPFRQRAKILITDN